MSFDIFQHSDEPSSYDDSQRPDSALPLTTGIPTEFGAALVVACVAIPMGMGIAAISGAPAHAGIIAGIVGGLVVGFLSGSPTSITGPSAGLTLALASLMGAMSSYETFLLAVVIAGVLQIMFGVVKLGWVSSFFPSSVLDALLAAIGIILIFKQIPHLLGHDTDPEGDMAFLQPDRQTTFSELLSLFEGDVHGGAALVGLTTLGLIMALSYFARKKQLHFPTVLIGATVGALASLLVNRLGEAWEIDGKHLISMPVWDKEIGWESMLRFPEWRQLKDPVVWLTGVAIAVISSLETLLNLAATDRIDRSDRPSPPNRELVAVGIGNTICGLIGGIPMSAAIERSAVCLQAGSRTKLCAFAHGMILLAAATLFPFVFNMIPLSVLAAVLIVTGIWLARPAVFVRVWQGGKYQIVPFLVTIFAILLSDLLIGVLVGLAFGVGFILNSNLRRPLRQVIEKHSSGEILHIELAEQVSFLNRPVIERALRGAPQGTHILLDATNSDYIDPDILSMIREFVKKSSIHQVKVSLRGFRQKYAIDNVIQFVDFTSREIQEGMSPDQALKFLQDGNQRFCENRRLSRDLGRQIQATSAGQHPFAAILSCIDSRAPVETILDLGLGDVFTARVAGNVVSPKILGSLEYATAVVGSKLIVVLGHTKCGAVHAAVNLADVGKTGFEATGCQHLDSILEEIHPSINLPVLKTIDSSDKSARDQFAEDVARRNVIHSVKSIVEASQTIHKLVQEGRLAVVGAIYDVNSGKVDFLVENAIGLGRNSELAEPSPSVQVVKNG